MKRRLLLAGISLVIFFSVGESMAYIVLEKYGNALDNTRKILVADQKVGWRQKPNLHTSFLKIPLQTNEWGWRATSILALDESTKKIVILGPSSSFGWGVKKEETYAFQLETLLRKETGVSVLNAGQIGYSSYQGRHVLSPKQLDTVHPGIVIVAYGINDLDKHRFYFQNNSTDKKEFAKPKSGFAVWTANIIRLDPFLNAMTKAIGVISTKINSPTEQGLVRVPIDDFKENLRAIIDMVHAQGSSVILLTTTTNLQPFLSSETNKTKKEELRRLINGIPEYNDAVFEIAKEKQVIAGDIDQWFGNENRSSFFVDPIHFSSLGNALIAEGLHQLITKNHLLDTKNESATNM